ncbi:hypothetical protein DL96DRAFT_1590177 [Flagelloscypha sp. PMI_526]|nr:hypothetical protein DL96DRAFT_1590177 [Flagelloscypha sp. PMI_526]
MGGDHKCPVCSATFTRPQHVTRHMRSHTGDRPYKCTFCGDQFARSDLLSRHVNKCHAGETLPPAGISGPVSTKRGKGGTVVLPCDGCNPCSKCISRKVRCTFVKFHRQTAPAGPGHSLPHYVTAMPIPGTQNPAIIVPSSSSLPSTFSVPSQFRFDNESTGNFDSRAHENAALRQIEYHPPTVPNDNPSSFYAQQQQHHSILSQTRPSSSSGAPSHLWDTIDSQFAYNLPPITESSSQRQSLHPSSSHLYDAQASSSWGSDSSFDDYHYRHNSSQSSSRPSSSSSSSQFAFSLDGSTNSRPSTRSGYDSRPATRSGEHMDDAFGSLTLDQQHHMKDTSSNFFTSLPDPNATPMPHPEGANIDPIVQHVMQQQEHRAYPPPTSSSSSSDAHDLSILPQSTNIPSIPFIPHNPALYALQTQSQSHLPPSTSPTREREQEMKDLREFWRAYMRTPLSQSPGMTPGGGIFMPPNGDGGPESLFPHDFATSSTVATTAGSTIGYRRQRTNSLPAVKTPLIFSEQQQLAPLAASIAGPVPQHQPTHQTGFTSRETDNLTSYQEAVMKRGGGLNLNLSREGSSLLRFRRGSGAASTTSQSSAAPLVTAPHSHGVNLATRPSFKRLASQILEGSVNKARRVDE